MSDAKFTPALTEPARGSVPLRRDQALPPLTPAKPVSPSLLRFERLDATARGGNFSLGHVSPTLAGGQKHPMPDRAMKLEFEILPQPNNFTCGPTCLHAVYRHFGDKIGLQEVIDETDMLATGGTLAVVLANQALRRGYEATIYTYNLEVFDPSWFLDHDDLKNKLSQQAAAKKDNSRLQYATEAYLEYLDLGGKLRFEDLTPRLLTRYLRQGYPLLTGLCSTYLYHEPREMPNTDYDDVKGDPAGHFVILTGYDRERREVHVADPLQSNPLGASQQYTVPIDRVVGAIFLGVMTHDANILILKPPSTGPKEHPVWT